MPVLLLMAVLAGCGGGDEAALRVDAVAVRVLAQERSWSASYRLGETSEIPTGREIHVPLGADVRLALASKTYICEFALPELGLRDFAAPGLPWELQFRAERAGRFELRGDELCGLPHSDRTRGHVVVEDAASYRAWVHMQKEKR